MRNRIFLIILGLVICCIAKAEDNQIIYQLKKEFYPSLRVRVEVNTKPLNSFVLEQSRYYHGDKRPVKQVYCADDNSKISYGQPAHCDLIYWYIDVKRQSLTGIGARSLEDYYLNNGQWTLAESKNFPRILGQSKELVCVDEHGCKPLPTREQPFLFWVWGKAPTHVTVANKQFEVFSDKSAEPINKRMLMVKVEPNLRYLNQVFTSQLGDYIKKPISLVMLERNDRVMEDAGGVAQDHVALVNYYTYGYQLAEDWEVRFHKTMLHEYVHLLVPCETFARWTCESLADYYAYKALTVGRLNTTAIHRWYRQSMSRPNKLGMYQIDKRFWQTGSWSYYSLFYVKGAAFWNELDSLLHKKYRNLDSYLQLLVMEPNHYQTDLPQPFVNKMIEIIGEQDYKKLSAKYLE
ncbi:hypothetical protein [Entomomonas asaccharolytica]|uniref:Uncharacterized protein n=1 Tax=Entomomonas asaccharolytica TaxID=2785331 RepID=A0A974NGB5_9GAMM|nr:hypothetical protein [Entomomonas asaccharolytica]QQP85977.1 hypothetical protein JHT90_01580 [Entomomonas asaccharolytica]